MSTRKTIEQEKQEKLRFEYKRVYYKDADLSFLENVPIACRKKDTVNDIIITFDTETSKSKKNTFFKMERKLMCLIRTKKLVALTTKCKNE